MDDETNWTLATTGNNTRRVSIDNLGVGFYTLQIRVDLDDDTQAQDQDTRILALSAIYSEGY